MSTLTTRFIPAKVTNSPWLTIVLHGLGDSMDGYIWMPHVLDMPWMNYLLVNAPDPYFQGFSWYDIFGENPTIGINRSRKLLLELLAEMQKNGFPLEKTYLFGFSQGCLMVLETGFQCSSKLAGIVGISGYVEDLEKFIAMASPAAKEQRILVTHGWRDPVLPFDRTREQIQILIRHGYLIEWHEFNKEHTIDEKDEIPIIKAFISSPYLEDVKEK